MRRGMGDDDRVPQRELAVGLVGHSGAGKTHVATSLAERLGASVVSFGDEVRRRVSAAGGDLNNRLQLMAVGQDLVERDVEGFCRAVLAQADHAFAAPLIIQGIRHDVVREMLETLIAPRRLVLVHLKAPDAVLSRRLRELGAGDAEVAALRRDPTEVEVDQVLLGHADLIVDAVQPLDEVVGEIEHFLRLIAETPEADRSPSGASDTGSSGDGLDETQQTELINDISTEFGLWLTTEVSAAVGLDDSVVSRALDSGTLLRLRHAHGDLIPGFQFKNGQIRAEVGRAVQRLRARLTDWELAAWFVSNNGWLDDQRPIDAGEDQLVMAVNAELDDTGF